MVARETKTTGRRWRQAQYAVAMAALGLLAAACGKKGDPTPPLRIIPALTTDLTASQRGDQLVLRFAYPATTTSGAKLPGLAAVEIWQLTRPAPDPTKPPIVEQPEFTAAAQPLATLSGAELQSATAGSSVVVRLPLPAPTSPPTAHFFGVKTLAEGGETSGWSNLAQLLPREALAPPADLAVTARAAGVELAWTTAAEGVVGFVVYRRPAVSRAYGEPIATVGPEVRQHLDTTAQYGERYIYTMTALASQLPRVESAFAAEREIDYQDRFPPAPPEGIVALPREGGVNLVWKPSADRDVVGYHVYRRDPGAEIQRLTAEPTRELKYSDTGLAAGLAFDYRVSAVDSAGNEGPGSPPLEARPR